MTTLTTTTTTTTTTNFPITKELAAFRAAYNERAPIDPALRPHWHDGKLEIQKNIDYLFAVEKRSSFDIVGESKKSVKIVIGFLSRNFELYTYNEQTWPLHFWCAKRNLLKENDETAYLNPETLKEVRSFFHKRMVELEIKESLNCKNAVADEKWQNEVRPPKTPAELHFEKWYGIGWEAFDWEGTPTDTFPDAAAEKAYKEGFEEHFTHYCEWPTD